MSNNKESNDLAKKKLTSDELKKFSGLSTLNEEQTNEIIESLYQLSLVAYSIYKNGRKN